jgi:gas vesicle protein
MLGAAAGAVAGLLAAPRTGVETRHILKKTADALPDLAEDLSTTVQLQADRLSEKALKNWDGTLERLKVAIAAGVEASRNPPASSGEARSDEAVPTPPDAHYGHIDDGE